MGYIKREKYTIINDNSLKKELLEILTMKGVPSVKARQLVYYPVPMSLIRWARWLDPEECERFLEPLNEEETEDMGF